MQAHLATLRPGALEAAKWEAAIIQHLDAPVEAPSDASHEAMATWSALWEMLSSVQLSGGPSLEFFVTR